MISLTRLSLSAFLALALAGAASAIPLTLNGPVNGNSIGPQSASNPCIIAGTTCQQPATMGYNNFTQGGNIDDFNMYSTTPTGTVADGVQGTPYTVGQLTAIGLTSFIVAIDVNTASGGETLQLFEVIIDGVVAYNYVGPTLIGNVANNGNGYGDWYLSTVSLAGLNPTSTVLFHAVWTDTSDGAESFFLVSTSSPSVPEPSSIQLMLAGTVLVGLGYAIRKRVAVSMN